MVQLELSHERYGEEGKAWKQGKGHSGEELQDHDTVKTERVIDVVERKRKYITAYCHLRKAVRTFKRSRIKEIVPA